MNPLPQDREKPAPSGISPPPLGRRDLAPCALIAGLIVMAFWPVVSCQRALFYLDITELNLPFRHFYGHWISLGRFPLWTDAIQYGYPIFAEGQAGALYPLNLMLFTWMPSWAAMNISTVGHLLALCLFGYLFFRTLASPAGATAGALALGLNAFVIQRHMHTAPLHQMTWAPLLFWIADRAFRTGRFRRLLAGAVVVAVQILAGQQQFAMVTAVALVPWIAFLAWTGRGAASRRTAALRAAKAVGVVYVLGAALAAAQLAPGVELLGQSVRAGGVSAAEASGGSWPPGLAPSLLFPDAYGSAMLDTSWVNCGVPIHEMGGYAGIATFLLAIIAAFRSPTRRATFFVGLGLAGLLLGMGDYGLAWPALHSVPVISSFRIPARMIFVTVFAECALAAAGIEALRSARPRLSLRAPLVAFWLLVTAAVALVMATYGSLAPLLTDLHAVGRPGLGAEARACVVSGLTVALAATCAVLASRACIPAWTWRWALTAIVCVDALLYLNGRVPTVSPSYWTQTPALAAALQRAPGHERFFNGGMSSVVSDRYMAHGWGHPSMSYDHALESIPDNTSAMYGLRSVSGRVAMRLDRYRRLWLADVHWKVECCGPRYMIRSAPLPARAAELLATAPGPLDPFHLYRMNHAAPRAWLVHSARAVPGLDAASEALPRITSPLREAVVECSPNEVASLREPLDRDSEGAVITRVEPEYITLAVRANARALVVIADTWYPGWRATVDGRPARIFPVNALFRGVVVEPGEHEVSMVFESASFRWGVAVSLGAMAALAALWVWPPRGWAPLTEMRPLSPWRAWRGWLVCGFMVVVAFSSTVNGDLWRRSAFPTYACPAMPGIRGLGRPAQTSFP